MRHFSLKHILAASVAAMGIVVGSQAATIPDNYLEITDYQQNFTTNPVSSSKFVAPLGWSSYSDGSSVSYTSASYNGGYGIGVSTDQVSLDRYNMIVTPMIKGDMTFNVRRYAYSDYYKFNMEFYRITLNDDGSYTFDSDTDRIQWQSPFAPDATGTDWLNETQSINVGDEYTYVGIRMSCAYIGNITVSSALIPVSKSMEIVSVGLLDGFSDKVKADDDGKISIGLKVTLKNTGNVTLSKESEGERWSYDLVHYTSSYGNPYTCVTLHTGELPTLPVGSEPVTFNVVGKIPAPTSGELQSDGSIRVRLDFVENYSDKEIGERYKTAGWYNIMSNKGVMELRYDKKTSATNKQTTTVDPSKPIYAGAFKGSRELTFKMRNRGFGDIVIESVDKPEWITLEDMGVGATVIANEEKEFKVIIGGETGYKEGSVKFNFDGISIVDEISFVADIVDEEGFLADFESVDALIGWYQPSNREQQWSVDNYSSTERDAKVSVAEYNFNDKRLANGRQATPGFDIFTPMLSFSEGESLSFWASKRANSGDDVYLEVKYSTDRANWTSLGKITVNNPDESLRFYCSNSSKPTSDGKDVMKHFQFTMPEGNYYISLTAGYVTVDNLYGGKKIELPYDIISENALAGKVRIVNNPLEFTANFKNINTTDIPAENMTLSLYANNEKVAETQPQSIAASEDVDFIFSYIPHQAGETILHAELAIGDYSVTSPAVTVAVKSESAESANTIGNVTSTDNAGPLYPSYNYSKSEFVYTKEDLAALGDGAKILRFSYPYYKTEVTHSTPSLTVWMENTDDQVVGDVFSDTDGLTCVRAPKAFVYEKAGSEQDLVEMTFELDEAFQYDGRNLRVVIEARGSDPKWQKCNFGLDLSDKTRLMRYYYNDNESTYDNNKDGAGSVKNVLPVITLYTETEVTMVSGNVVDQQGQAIAGAMVRATAKDADVFYDTTTDEDGHWGIIIYQNSYDYTVTASADGYIPSVASDLDMEGENNIILAEVPVPAPTNGAYTPEKSAVEGCFDVTFTWEFGDDEEVSATSDDTYSFNVHLNGQLHGNTEDTTYTVTGLEKGNHTVSVYTLSSSGRLSEALEIPFVLDETTGVITVGMDEEGYRYFDLNGREITAKRLDKGIYIRVNGARIEKVIVNK